MFIYRNLVSLK